jgi:hypothetical protein
MTFLLLRLTPHSPKLKDNLTILGLLQLVLLEIDDHDLKEEAWCRSKFMSPPCFLNNLRI